MDPITSPDPTPLWREGDYPFVWILSQQATGANPPENTHKKAREGYRVNPRGDFIVLVFLWRLIDKTPEENGVN
ncbi:hypothetical protein ITZ88_001430 [Escherichia coli]|uniref:hypothetical protein n=1 Tax=Escherichia coli TaxID=562 RepID=UPI0015A6A54D|nr:hypothetical protein [Escherichia coli]HEP0855283.1 hypothetical protein [Enterobacter asburiae]EFN7312425.1 hypothetical protein [Escherichia coli]EGO4155987.1 hypothetical protein [Escherichia coli]ELG7494545.1 hypothetical protein [Escherichia coli]EMA4168743.1 hypothetical protein [Escherichia coli]